MSKKKIITLLEDVDKNGIFYTIHHLPKKIRGKFVEYFDKKNDNWWFEKVELKRIKKILKKRGFIPKISRLNQAFQSLDDALNTEGLSKDVKRTRCQYKQLNELMGGDKETGKTGFAKGSITLIGGEPGAGKSTLTNQLLLHWSNKKRVIYINTEESLTQVNQRFFRLNEKQPFNKRQRKNLQLFIVQDVDLIRNRLKKEDAPVVILDSLGGLVESAGAARGGVKILREASGIINEYVKWKNRKSIGIMIGHINAAGKIAGPKSIQHMCEAILFLQGNGRIRTIQPLKNRNGSTVGMIKVAMTETGLEFEEAETVDRNLTPGQNIAHIQRDNATPATEDWEQM